LELTISAPASPTLSACLAARAARLCAMLMLAIATPAIAQTSCTAANQYSYSFATATAATLSYTGTSSYTATRTAGGAQSFSVGFQTFNLSSSTINGTQMPAITNLINDGSPTTANNLMIGGTFAGRTTTITANSNVIVTTLTFATPVREFTIQVNDIDFATNQYRDWLHIVGVSGGSTYTASISTPFGSNNGAGAKTATNSTLQLGTSTTPLTVGVNEGIGNATSGNTANNGTLTAVFTQPVTSIVLRYGNSNQTPGGTTTGQQAFGIQRVAFCPMPNIVVDKTSAPATAVATDPNRFNIPGADVDYTITVTNNGGSTVDATTIVLTDLLPPNVTFNNVDLDAGTAGVQPYVLTAGTSGVALAAANVAYTNNNGSTYSYAPAAGIDPAVDGVRYSPTGTMAANSSFSVRFRTRVN
jgi:uncharacterized repeat protein (TIGR01451 family)